MLLEKYALKLINDLEYYRKINSCRKCRRNWIWNEIFKKQLLINIRKVKDHNHLTGKYRGAAHSYCNLNYKNPVFLPVYMYSQSSTLWYSIIY